MFPGPLRSLQLYTYRGHSIIAVTMSIEVDGNARRFADYRGRLSPRAVADLDRVGTVPCSRDHFVRCSYIRIVFTKPLPSQGRSRLTEITGVWRTALGECLLPWQALSESRSRFRSCWCGTMLPGPLRSLQLYPYRVHSIIAATKSIEVDGNYRRLADGTRRVPATVAGSLREP